MFHFFTPIRCEVLGESEQISGKFEQKP
uniref:Uncharacterized protein n=1 Tax=Anguilla anguilla TaxID=7936 RepID=A0A0E9PM63_ANGAN